MLLEIGRKMRLVQYSAAQFFGCRVAPAVDKGDDEYLVAAEPVDHAPPADAGCGGAWL
jgi:hypothetical protein